MQYNQKDLCGEMYAEADKKQSRTLAKFFKTKNETTKTLNQEIINIINDLADLENKSMQLKQKLQATKKDLYYLERQISLDKKDLKALEVQNG
jgi:predicted  nucleic acid-binding Zn-ribbon protein